MWILILFLQYITRIIIKTYVSHILNKSSIDLSRPIFTRVATLIAPKKLSPIHIDRDIKNEITISLTFKEQLNISSCCE